MDIFTRTIQTMWHEVYNLQKSETKTKLTIKLGKPK